MTVQVAERRTAIDSVRIGGSALHSSRLVYGCMRLTGDGSSAALDRGRRAIEAALQAGYTQFDHADIYAGGRSEALFGEVLAESPGLRERIVVTTKCGIRFAGVPDEGAPKRYDASYDHIVASVERSLQRLGIEQIDLLLLHRPDFLMSATEVARAFDRLAGSGQVGHFGVSNFSASQLALLASEVGQPLLVNQVEINLQNTSALTNGTLDQCQERGITPQAWSPLAGVAYPGGGDALSPAAEKRLRIELERQGRTYGADDWLIALAWLLRHAAGIAPVIGSTTPERIARATHALDIDYTREDWYRLLEARNGREVP